MARRTGQEIFDLAQSYQRFYAYNHFGQHPGQLIAWFDKSCRDEGVVPSLCMSALGQNAKYSVRADVFRFAVKLRHCSMRSPIRIWARRRHFAAEHVRRASEEPLVGCVYDQCPSPEPEEPRMHGTRQRRGCRWRGYRMRRSWIGCLPICQSPRLTGHFI
jgi:hypothetical protein